MGIRRGEITTKIVSDGLIFNFDAANRASYVNGSTKTFNTINLSQSGSLENSPTFISSPAAWDFDGLDTYINCGDIEMDGITGLTVEAWCKSTQIHERTRSGQTPGFDDRFRGGLDIECRKFVGASN